MKLASYIFFVLTLLPLPARAAEYPKREIRAVWLSTIYGMDWPAKPAGNAAERKAQQKELCDRLDMLRNANFNMVFLQVRLRGDVIYPSAIEPMNRIFAGRHGASPGYDPLAFALEECRKRGLECHAWFITYPIGSMADVKSKGSKSVVARKPELCKLYNGEWYLNPGMPETSDYILAMVRELLRNYDVDGIHFDHIRYPENAEGFPDGETYAKYGKSNSLRAWRQNNINRMVERIYDWVKRYKPWVQVSASPLGKYSPLMQVPNAGLTAFDVYQDPQEWLRMKKQDMIVPMMYYRDSFFYPFVDNWMANRNGRFLVLGLGVYKLAPGDSDWTLRDITSQIDYVRASGADGITFFRGMQLFRNTKGVYTVLKDKYFKYPALLPPLTWLSRQRPGAPVDVRIRREGNRLKISWNMPDDTEDDPGALRYTVYYSRSNTVNTALAQNILATGIPESEIYLAVESEKEQELSFRISASNRYHIESRPSREVYYYLTEYEK
ncbi:MAG: family 10 glycosylhydrolase [Tannerellaceae bacterium]|jgi:uncharacterized lipoprotein YddW (UPF0748 family)|nr:family 10 glycosylhydrolase [Tannerellaceae bacterium]